MMTKLKMIIELEYDANIMHGDDREAIDWFLNDVLKGEGLFLHSNEIGDTIGSVKVLSVTNEGE